MSACISSSASAASPASPRVSVDLVSVDLVCPPAQSPALPLGLARFARGQDHRRVDGRAPRAALRRTPRRRKHRARDRRGSPALGEGFFFSPPWPSPACPPPVGTPVVVRGEKMKGRASDGRNAASPSSVLSTMVPHVNEVVSIDRISCTHEFPRARVRFTARPAPGTVAPRIALAHGSDRLRRRFFRTSRTTVSRTGPQSLQSATLHCQ